VFTEEDGYPKLDNLRSIARLRGPQLREIIAAYSPDHAAARYNSPIDLCHRTLGLCLGLSLAAVEEVRDLSREFSGAQNNSGQANPGQEAGGSQTAPAA